MSNTKEALVFVDINKFTTGLVLTHIIEKTSIGYSKNTIGWRDKTERIIELNNKIAESGNGTLKLKPPRPNPFYDCDFTPINLYIEPKYYSFIKLSNTPPPIDLYDFRANIKYHYHQSKKYKLFAPTEQIADDNLLTGMSNVFFVESILRNIQIASLFVRGGGRIDDFAWRCAELPTEASREECLAFENAKNNFMNTPLPDANTPLLEYNYELTEYEITQLKKKHKFIFEKRNNYVRFKKSLYDIGYAIPIEYGEQTNNTASKNSDDTENETPTTNKKPNSKEYTCWEDYFTKQELRKNLHKGKRNFKFVRQNEKYVFFEYQREYRFRINTAPLLFVATLMKEEAYEDTMLDTPGIYPTEFFNGKNNTVPFYNEVIIFKEVKLYDVKERRYSLRC